MDGAACFGKPHRRMKRGTKEAFQSPDHYPSPFLGPDCPFGPSTLASTRLIISSKHELAHEASHQFFGILSTYGMLNLLTTGPLYPLNTITSPNHASPWQPPTLPTHLLPSSSKTEKTLGRNYPYLHPPRGHLAHFHSMHRQLHGIQD